LAFEHYRNAFYDVTEKEYHVLKGYGEAYSKKMNSVSFKDGIKNILSKFIWKPFQARSELKRDISIGIPLEYEVNDYDFDEYPSD
jgi:hypothetical protein